MVIYGNNKPRMYGIGSKTPVVLVESQSQNLVTYSGSLKSGDQSVFMDTPIGYREVDWWDAGNNNRVVYRPTTTLFEKRYTLSAFMKPSNPDKSLRLVLFFQTGPSSTSHISANYHYSADLLATSQPTSARLVGATRTRYPDGWVRLSITGYSVTPTAEEEWTEKRISAYTYANGVGSEAAGLERAYYTGYQLEEGVNMTSYIPAYNNQPENRAQEYLKIPLPDYDRTKTPLTLTFGLRPTAVSTTNFRSFLHLAGASNARRLWLSNSAGNLTLFYPYQEGGGNAAYYFGMEYNVWEVITLGIRPGGFVDVWQNGEKLATPRLAAETQIIEVDLGRGSEGNSAYYSFGMDGVPFIEFKEADAASIPAIHAEYLAELNKVALP